MQLDVWSDVICPWCWLGDVRLHAALDRLDLAGEVTLRHRSFLLDPRAPDRPGDLRAAIDAKYGTGAFETMTGRLTAMGAEAGIDYRFDRALRVSSFDAHRLVQATQTTHPDATATLVARLYRAYFHDGLDVADRSVLAALGHDAGLDPTWAQEVLDAEAHADTVHADQAEAAELGITGVPCVTWQGATVIPGAQEVDTMVLVLSRLQARSRRAGDAG